jgi:predicted lactoylglutathione lyase
MANVYINLPVADLPKATAFYEAIGFTRHPEFSDEKASGMVYDETLSVMLLTHEFTKTFLPAHKTIADSHKTCALLTALQVDSKEAVDAFYEKALAA